MIASVPGEVVAVLERVDGRFLAPRRRSDSALLTWLPPWWVSLIGAIAALGLTVVVYGTNEEVVRPDVGYVVSKPRECRVGLARDSKATRPDVVVNTEERPGSRDDDCRTWDLGTKIWYDRDDPGQAVGEDPTDTTRETWFLGLGFALLLCLALAAGDVVRRRRQLLSPTYRALFLEPQQPPRPGKTYDHISTARDLLLLRQRAQQKVQGRGDYTLAKAMILDLRRSGHLTVTDPTDPKTTLVLSSGPRPTDPLAALAFEELAPLDLRGEQPATTKERLGLALLKRWDSKPLTLVRAIKRLADLSPPELTSVAVAGEEVAAEVRAVILGQQEPDERTMSLIAVGATGAAFDEDVMAVSERGLELTQAAPDVEWYRAVRLAASEARPSD